MNRLLYVLLIAGCSLGGACANAAWYEDSQSIMGTRIHAELWSEDSAAAQAVLSSIMDEMQRVEDAYSPYLAASELSRLNEPARVGWVDVSAELFGLLEQSRHASQITDGAFDITYASVGRSTNARAASRRSGGYSTPTKARSLRSIIVRCGATRPCRERWCWNW
ncbi:MAG: FAD:protein FMN transferase [Pseudomonadales bacterium]